MSQRRTIVVQGPLAYGMRRLKAATRGESGINLVTLPQLAAELAGGFLHLAPNEAIETLIKERLVAGGFEDLEDVHDLPGMTRAVTATLRKIWHADLALRRSRHAGKARVKDLITIEEHLERRLPAGALIAPVCATQLLAGSSTLQKCWDR
jgi:hypothetical protein